MRRDTYQPKISPKRDRASSGRPHPPMENQRFPTGCFVFLPVQSCHRSPKPPAATVPFTVSPGSPEAGSRFADRPSSGSRSPPNGCPPELRNPRFPAPCRRLLDIAQRPIPCPWSDHLGPTQARWRACFFAISREFPLEAVSSEILAEDGGAAGIRREGPILMGRDKKKRPVQRRKGDPARILAPLGGLGGQVPPVRSLEPWYDSPHGEEPGSRVAAENVRLRSHSAGGDPYGRVRSRPRRAKDIRFIPVERAVPEIP